MDAIAEGYESPRTERLLRPREAAELLNVSPRTLDRLIASGELRAVRVGGSRRIRPTDVRDLVERGSP
jgi:excisionase family DNA binding protein